MSLFDVDLNSSDGQRLNPVPNAPDRQAVDANGVLSPMAHATSSIAYRASGSGGLGKTVSKNDRTVVYDSANSRIIMGLLPDGTYGLVISKPGFDVLSQF